MTTTCAQVGLGLAHMKRNKCFAVVQTMLFAAVPATAVAATTTVSVTTAAVASSTVF